VVTLRVIDKDGGVSPPARPIITVDNGAPKAGVSGPSDGVRGQARTFTLTASDPSSVDQAAGFAFNINWGDGATQTVSGPSGTTVSHVFSTSGSYSVKVTARDKDGGTSAATTQKDTITAAALGGRPDRTQQDCPVRRRRTGADTITIKPVDANATVNVKIGTTSLGNFKPTGHIVVYGQAGDDLKLLTASINSKSADHQVRGRVRPAGCRCPRRPPGR
jgi:PKD domain